MFNDKVTQAIADRGLGSFHIVEESHQPEPVGPEAQKLQRQGRVYSDRGDMLDNLAAIEHGYKRSAQLRREARVCHDLAERYFDEAKVLSHYGSKGMRWGVRRTKKQLASRSAAKTQAKAAKASAKAAGKIKKGEAKAAAKAGAKIEKQTKKQLKAGDKAGTKAAKLKKQARKMSDSDLKKAVDRLQMEKKYSDLNTSASTKTKTRSQRGKKEVSTILKTGAKQAVQSHTTNIMKQALTIGIQKSSPRLKNYKPPKSAKV